MTPDGRFVAFVSEATNLVAGDTNKLPDVFVRDISKAETRLVSVGAKPYSTSPVPAGASESPQISSDGRYVAFYSTATNLVPGMRLTTGHIFVRDTVDNVTFWVSADAPALLQAYQKTTNAACYNHVMSSDGAYVAYQASRASAIFTNGLVLRVRLSDLSTELVSSNASYGNTAFDLRSVDMTPDGRRIAFVATTNGVNGTTSCVLVWDSDTGETVTASVNLDGKVQTASICDAPRLDAAGRFVAFLSTATNMVTNAVSGEQHMYLRDLEAGTTVLVDQQQDGSGGAMSPASWPRITPDARYVAFESADADFVDADSNHQLDVFIRDCVAGRNELISARHDLLPGWTPNGISTLNPSSLNTDGRVIAYASTADNLLADDTNGLSDVFVRALTNSNVILVSANTNGLVSDGPSFDPCISGDARYVAFTSSGDDLVEGDTNRFSDIFLHDLTSGSTSVASVSTNGFPGNRDSYAPVLGSNGRYLLFRSKASDLANGARAGVENLFLRDLSAETTYALCTTGFVSVACTRDCRFIAFSDAAAAGTIYLWDSQIDSVTWSKPVSAAFVFGVSPNGNDLLFRGGPDSTSLSVYRRDADTNFVLAGGVSPGIKCSPRFSADGRFVAYDWARSTTNISQVYLYDFLNGTNILVTHAPGLKTVGAASSDSPDISPDGRYVGYRSGATNLIEGATNGIPQVYLWDQVVDANVLMSVSRMQAGGDNRSLPPVFSADGQRLVFESWASDLAAGDYNRGADLFEVQVLPAPITLLYASIAWDTSGFSSAMISWPVIAGKQYHVQYKDGLTDPEWIELPRDSMYILGKRVFLKDMTVPGAQRFYRVLAF